MAVNAESPPAAPSIPEPAAGAARESGQPLWRRVSKRVLGYAVLGAAALAFLVPFVLALATSFKTRPDAAQNPLSFIPQPITLEAWQRIAEADVWRWAFNSVVITVATTILRLFLDSLAGYSLARLRWPGRSVVFALVIAVLAVPPIVLAIPRFIILGELQMLNSYQGIILPQTVDAFGVFLMKQFFEGIPKEMEEAAHIDGASIFQTYWHIILPLARPGLIALTILSFQGSWNEFLHVLIAAPSAPELRNLPVGLALLRGQFGESLDFPALLAGSVTTTIPVAIIFLMFQRYFVRGVAASGVKG
ncbi:MAG: carbohydrate ABC transporter permease [Acidimicrobiales bacterium]